MVRNLTHVTITDDDANVDSRPVAASYARFSSELQDEQSLRDQQRECREKAHVLGFQIPEQLQFEDEAISGTKLHRPGLDRLLQQVQNREFSVLVVFSLSRLGREQIITMPLLKQLVYESKIRVVSVSEGVDTSRSEWETLATLFVLQHGQYIKDLSANVHRGHVGTLLANYSVGDFCLGYKTVPAPDGTMSGRGRNAKPKMVYQIDEERAEWVRRIFEWFATDRLAINQIVRRLNEQRAPKDHRSSTSGWHHNYVLNILRNEKYIGVWKWGLRKTERRPSDGRVRQIKRSERETAAWTRSRPELRIVTDALFGAAQVRLNKNREQFAAARDTRGRLRGAPRQPTPRHWLSQVLQCPECHSLFQIAGSRGEYWRCPKAVQCGCACKTSIRRDLIERKLAAAISQLVQSNQEWRQQVVEFTLRETEKWQTEIPQELQQLESQKQRLQQRMEKLLDAIEIGEADTSISQRLQGRRQELGEVERRIQGLRSQQSRVREAPTVEWIEQQLDQLGQLLETIPAEQRHIIRDLFAGPITLSLATTPYSKRPYYRAQVLLRIAVVQDLVSPSVAGVAVTLPLPVSVVVDLVDRSTHEDLADRAWELYQQNWIISQIAQELEVSISKVSSLMQIAAQQRGVALPDGRARRSRLPQKRLSTTKFESLMERAMELFQQQRLLSEIAKELDCNRDLVTKIVQRWHAEHGLPVPDGRTRRKSLEVKGRPPHPGDRRRRAS